MAWGFIIATVSSRWLDIGYYGFHHPQSAFHNGFQISLHGVGFKLTYYAIRSIFFDNIYNWKWCQSQTSIDFISTWLCFEKKILSGC